MPDLFFLTEIEASTRRLAPDVRLAHPFLLEPIEGVDAVVPTLRACAAALGSKLEACYRFQDDSGVAVSWRCGQLGGEIQGVTLALTNARGDICDLSILLRPVQFLHAWRERLRPWLASQPGTWELTPPDAAEVAEPTHRRFPFPLSDDAVFHAPACVRPVRGADAVSHVLAHASAAYGECEYGIALRSGNQFFRAFTSKVLPLEIASVARLDADQRTAEVFAFMRPWSSMIVFRDRLRASLKGYLDDSFYDLRTDEVV